MTGEAVAPEVVWARLAVVEQCVGRRPLALAVRLEAFYQHYARHAVMGGEQPMARHDWWLYVLAQGVEVAAFIAFDRERDLTDAAGACM